MKKRWICTILAALMALSLTACGEKKEEPAQEPEQVEETVDAPETEAPEEVPAESEEEPAPEEEPEAPAELPENAGGQESADQKPENKPAETPAEKPAEKPAVPTQKPAVPAEKPAEKPAEPAAPAAGKSVDLAAFYETVASGGNMPALMQLESEMLDALYPDLSAIKTNQCAVYTAMISAAVGEIALVEVQSASDVQAVKDIFQARIDYQVGDDQNPGGAWYPASIEGWKNGSRIVANGNYIMLIALSDGADTVVDSFNALFA